MPNPFVLSHVSGSSTHPARAHHIETRTAVDADVNTPYCSQSARIM